MHCMGPHVASALCWNRRTSLLALLALALVLPGAAGLTDYPAEMILTVTSPDYPCFLPGQSVLVTLSMCCLQQPVTGYQAFIQFDPAVLTFVQGSYTLPDPFGLPIVPITTFGDLVGLAAGINPWLQQQPTQQDADLATLEFLATAPGGVALMFPEHQPPTCFSYYDTRIYPGFQIPDPFQVAPQCPVTLGDMDCNGSVDFDDINPFVLALSDPATYVAAFPTCNWYNGDCNCDGTVDFDDINAFVACLGGDCHCPTQ